MADLRSRVEVTKLASELGTSTEKLGFLAEHDADQVRELRTAVAGAMFGRNEDRLVRIASLTNLIPPALAAKIAEIALGPMLSARVAGVLNPTDAVRLAKHLDPPFLTEVSKSLDPQRVEPILRRLPTDLVVDVGRRLLAQGEHLTLGRFVAAVELEAALGVVDGANGSDLLQVALHTEEPEALEAIVERLPDKVLGTVIRAAADESAWDDALTLLTSLSDDSTRRLLGQLGVVLPEECNDLVTAVIRNDAWEHILPGIDGLDSAVLRTVVNVPATLDIDVIDRVLTVAHHLNEGAALVQLVLGLDDEHLDVVESSKVLAQPDVRDWLKEHAGVGERLVIAVLTELGFAD